MQLVIAAAVMAIGFIAAAVVLTRARGGREAAVPDAVAGSVSEVVAALD